MTNYVINCNYMAEIENISAKKFIKEKKVWKNYSNSKNTAQR